MSSVNVQQQGTEQNMLLGETHLLSSRMGVGVPGTMTYWLCNLEDAH